MKNRKGKMQCDIGMIGLGTMGRNLLLNMVDHGFTVAGFDKDKEKVDSLCTESGNESSERRVYGTTSIEDFIGLLKQPRMMMLLVPAGKPVDIVINELVPLLQKSDLIIDAGNSHFTDTDRRLKALQTKGFQFLGIGISGGEEGARHGPSIMPGGTKEAYEIVRPVLEAVAAKVEEEPCVTYLGAGSVGHYVKMVHNGIEYGIMQLIAETYDVMKRGLGLSDAQLSTVYSEWNDTELASYLLEITSHIFSKKDEKTGKQLIDEIVAVAKQNGTGMWTSESSMALQLPVPAIDVAVTLRDLSVFVEERGQASVLYHRPIPLLAVDSAALINQLKEAFFTAMIIVYAQGMALLTGASETYSYQLNLEAVAKIWRGGCIIRAKLLDDICSAYHKNNKLTNLLLDPDLSQKIMMRQEQLRQVICQAANAGIPVPVLMSALSYLDVLRSIWLPANLIQAQRDYFGAHTYERTDEEGAFHVEWEKK